MAEPKDCPRCGLASPPEAVRCDCGYDFAAGRFVGSLLPPARAETSGSPTALALAIFLMPVGAVIGAGIGIPVRVWGAGPAVGGLGVLPLILEGLAGGALTGGVAGAVATVLIARRWRGRS